jgi:tartrate-resistant acid phosphatase type 5
VNAPAGGSTQGLLKEFSVAAYFNGHDHNLQHIKKQHSSVQYITSGAGSAVRHDVHDNWPSDGSLKRL